MNQKMYQQYHKLNSFKNLFTYIEYLFYLQILKTSFHLFCDKLITEPFVLSNADIVVIFIPIFVLLKNGIIGEVTRAQSPTE